MEGDASPRGVVASVIDEACIGETLAACVAEEAARQGIVESVSIAEVGRWLKKGGFSPTVAGIG